MRQPCLFAAPLPGCGFCFARLHNCAPRRPHSSVKGVVHMRSRRGFFWQSLVFTLILLVPMMGVTLWLQQGQQQQQALRQAAAQRGGITVEAGSQSVWRFLLVVQQEQPAFVLARADSLQQTVTLCALPADLQVNAPAGTTTLGECALTAGAGRAAQLLQQTLFGDEAAPALYYLAATPATWQTLADADEVRWDTAALFDAANQRRMGLDADPIAVLTADTAAGLLAKAQRILAPETAAAARAAVWCAFLRQQPALLPALADRWRQYSARTLTNLHSGDLTGAGECFGYLSRQEALRIDYLQVPIQDNTLTAEAMRTLREMLG